MSMRDDDDNDEEEDDAGYAEGAAVGHVDVLCLLLHHLQVIHDENELNHTGCAIAAKLQFHENSSFHSKNYMHFFWNKNRFFIIVLQLYDVISNLKPKRCTKPPC